MGSTSRGSSMCSWRTYIILIVTSSIAATQSSRKGSILSPELFNLAENRFVDASSTCGDGVDMEEYCLLGEDRYGQHCDYCDKNDPRRSHPAKNVIYNNVKHWLSPPLSRSTKYHDVNLTIHLGQDFHVAYVYIEMGNSPRPGVWALERSVDDGKTYQPWQYFASDEAECQKYFGADVEFRITRDDSVICDTRYSKILPFHGGEIHVPLQTGRPSSENFLSSEALQNWTRATNIRLRLMRIRTLSADVLSVDQQDPTVTRRYFYSIRYIDIGGRCVCNGHASNCNPSSEQKLVCTCQHNTDGNRCEKCAKLFNQKKWKAASIENPNECEKCNCHEHAHACQYNATVDELGLSKNTRGEYSGGGVCIDCMHNTDGINCEKCKPRYYQIRGKYLTDPDVCGRCPCDFEGRERQRYSGECEDLTARCKCNPMYREPLCDLCSDGLYGYPDCRPCDCFQNGTVGGICEIEGRPCPCKSNCGGNFCKQCARGYYGHPQCKPCGCNREHSVDPDVCNSDTGKCQCSPGFGGRQCDVCEVGFYNYPDCQSHPKLNMAEQGKVKESFVWRYFNECEHDSVKCSLCGVDLAFKGGSTSTLVKHLKLKHNITDSGPAESPWAGVKRRGILSPANSVADRSKQMETMVARLAAEDNIPFKTIASSRTLRALFGASIRQRLPRSAGTIRSIVLKAADQHRMKIKEELRLYQLAGGSFSVAFDEATAQNSTFRYLTISLRAEADTKAEDQAGPDIYLGLERIEGSATGQNIADAVRGRLSIFGVDLRNCHFAVTDGGSNMASAVRQLGLKSQLCLVHALHLALSKVLRLQQLDASQVYMSDVMAVDDSSPDQGEGLDSSTGAENSEVGNSASEDEEADNSSDDEEAYDSSDLEDDSIRYIINPHKLTSSEVRESVEIRNGQNISIENPMSTEELPRSSETEPELDDSLNPIATSVMTAIDRIRSILKKIKSSGPMRDRLRALTKLPEYNEKPLQVLLDVKTRWYSTITMLERALLILPAINKLLEENNEQPVNWEAKKELEDILDVLLPFKHAMKFLCSAEATLVHADRIILALLHSFEGKNSTLASSLRKAVIDEISKRRTPYASVLQYLADPSYEYEVELALNMSTMSHGVLQDLLVKLLEQDDALRRSNETSAGSAETRGRKSYDFKDVFAAPLRRLKKTSPATETLSQAVLREMKMHEAQNRLGKYLSICLRRLLTVQPTSVKPERDFSVMNCVCSKSRNSLSPITLDSLVLLRAAYSGAPVEEIA